MVAVPLFKDTNMAAVTSREDTLYVDEVQIVDKDSPIFLLFFFRLCCADEEVFEVQGNYYTKNIK